MAYCGPRGIPHSVFLSWPELDQDKALEWAREQATVCDGCGTRRAEWDADGDAYYAVPSICRGCEAIEYERESVPDKAKGVRIGLMERAVVEAKQLAAEAAQEGSG